MLNDVKKIAVEFTEQQVQNFVQIVDMAVKAGGIGVARAATDLSDVVAAAVQKQLAEVKEQAKIVEESLSD